MGSIRRAVVVLSLAFAVLPAVGEAQSRPRVDRNKITAEQIAERQASNVYDLIKALRPNWFSVRGSATFQTRDAVDAYSGKMVTVPTPPEITVYVDDIKFGTHDDLKSLPTSDIELMERLDAASATQRFGTNHEHGAIVIRRRTR